MTEGEAQKNPDTSQGQEASIAEEDFASLFEESLQAVQPGGVVTGRVVDTAQQERFCKTVPGRVVDTAQQERI